VDHGKYHRMKDKFPLNGECQGHAPLGVRSGSYVQLFHLGTPSCVKGEDRHVTLRSRMKNAEIVFVDNSAAY